MIRQAIICFAIALSLCGTAAAQDMIADAVRDNIRDLAGDGEKLVGKIEIAELEPYDYVEFVIPIYPAKLYYVYGACDEECYSVGLSAHNVQKRDIDDEAGEEPGLIIGRGESGNELHVVIELEDCGTDMCYVGFGVYEAAS